MIPCKDLDANGFSHLPGGFCLSTLRSCESELIESAWKFKLPGTLDYIKHIIANFPNSCVRERETGPPVGWFIMQYNGSMGMLYVREEQRRQGLAQCLVHSLSDKLAKQGWPLFVYVEDDNTASQAFFKRCGFSHVQDYKEAWYHCTPHGSCNVDE